MIHVHSSQFSTLIHMHFPIKIQTLPKKKKKTKAGKIEIGKVRSCGAPHLPDK